MRYGFFFVLALFAAAAVILTVTVPTLYLAGSAASRHSRDIIADVAAQEIARTDFSRPGRVDESIRSLTKRYGLQSILLRSPLDTQATVRGALVKMRRAGPVIIEIHFAPDPISAARQPLLLAGGACVIASMTALVLLGSSFLHRAGPEKPASDTSYLWQTFETSIRTMKGRASELERQREREKERADELAVITGTLVRSITSGLLSVDEQGLVVDMNEEARALLRVPDSGYAGKSITAALGQTPFAKTVQGAVDQRSALQREEIAGHADESLIGLTTVPLRDERGRYFGMLALFTDLMPVRSLERRVRDLQSLADLGELSAGIAHEFRNSLSTILGYLNLAKKCDLPPEAEERLRRAELEARQLNTAVQSLMAFARPMPLDLQPVDLLALASEVVAQIQAVAPAVRFEVSGDTLQIEGDPQLLRRVLDNVVRNAVDAIRQKGTAGHVAIRVSARPEAVVQIVDDGAGVDPAITSKAFLPFQSTRQNGFGLGLALAKKIVLLHGGTISLAGAPSGGAIVVITVPLRYKK